MQENTQGMDLKKEAVTASRTVDVEDSEDPRRWKQVALERTDLTRYLFYYPSAERRFRLQPRLLTESVANDLRRARCFIQCLLMRRRDPCSLDPLKPLTAANLSRCLEAVSAVRERIPGLFPPGFDDKEAARILGALNTNSHEVGKWVPGRHVGRRAFVIPVA